MKGGILIMKREPVVASFDGKVEKNWKNSKIDKVYLYNVTEICDSAFICSRISKVNIISNEQFCEQCWCAHIDDDYWMTVGDYAFYKCKNLKKFDMGAVKYLGDSAFERSGIKRVIIGDEETPPDGEVKIGSGCFRKCTKLKKVVLKNVKTIPPRCFEKSVIKNLYISNSVINIAEDAFLSASIKHIYYDGTAEQWVQLTENLYDREYDNVIFVKNIDDAINNKSSAEDEIYEFIESERQMHEVTEMVKSVIESEGLPHGCVPDEIRRHVMGELVQEYQLSGEITDKFTSLIKDSWVPYEDKLADEQLILKLNMEEMAKYVNDDNWIN